MSDDFMQSAEFQALIKEYLEYLNTSLPTVQTNLTDGLYADVYKFGHNIKGTGTSYGYENLTLIGADICTNIDQENYSAVTTLLKNVGEIVSEALS